MCAWRERERDRQRELSDHSPSCTFVQIVRMFNTYIKCGKELTKKVNPGPSSSILGGKQQGPNWPLRIGRVYGLELTLYVPCPGSGGWNVKLRS